MNDFRDEEFSFKALKGISTLAYLIALVDSEEHEALNPRTACYGILYSLAEGEEQITDADDLLGMQAQFLPESFLPQTPVMFVENWSPVYDMLKKGFRPLALNRLDVGYSVVSTGIWKPENNFSSKAIEECQSDEELFWAILHEAFNRARQSRKFINIISQPGWSYDQMDLLPKFNDDEIAKSGRILWKRTWEG